MQLWSRIDRVNSAAQGNIAGAYIRYAFAVGLFVDIPRHVAARVYFFAGLLVYAACGYCTLYAMYWAVNGIIRI